jgi:hypothetical protein
VFCYDAFVVDAPAGKVTFHFSHRDERSFVALNRFSTALHVSFPGGVAPPGAAAAAFSVGMASLPWLWVGVPTRRVVVRAAALSAEQCAFWTHAYNNALGEFFALHALPYPHGLSVECDAAPRPLSPRRGGGDPDAPAPTLPPAPRAAAAAHARPDAARRVLVPMGGGKDSLTVWELLRNADGPPRCEWFFLGDDAGEFEANWRCAPRRRVGGGCGCGGCVLVLFARAALSVCVFSDAAGALSFGAGTRRLRAPPAAPRRCTWRGTTGAARAGRRRASGASRCAATRGRSSSHSPLPSSRCFTVLTPSPSATSAPRARATACTAARR